jgi:hypothetical protein
MAQRSSAELDECTGRRGGFLLAQGSPHSVDLRPADRPQAGHHPRGWLHRREKFGRPFPALHNLFGHDLVAMSTIKAWVTAENAELT